MQLLLKTLLGFCLLLSACAHADQVIDLHPGPIQGSQDFTHDEKQYFSPIWNTEVVTNVSRPTLTAFLPDASEANGTAVIIAPGGGFHALSINSEGNDVAAWLNERGVAAFVLRYRLVPTGADGVREMMSKAREQSAKDMNAVVPLAGADGLAAMRYVREHAEELRVSPERIGFMGFSAGGAVTAFVAFNAGAESRPDFVAPIYAAISMLQNQVVPADAAPMFVVAASDDQLGLAPDSVTLYNKWLEAGKSTELHLYARGGHGFGMRKQDLPTDAWIERFGEWLAVQGLL